MVTSLGMLGRTLAFGAFMGVVIVAMLLLATDARAGDEDFFGIEGRPIAMNVTVDPGDLVDKWWWDFEGDGCYTWSSAAGPNTTHTYQEAGLYYPVLKATNDSIMVKTWIFQALVDPDNEPPEVVASPEYLEVLRGETASFTGTAIDDGQVVLYEWDFDGDGSFDFQSVESAATTWVYNGLGEFTAVLRATDDQGATGTSTVTVLVHNQPPTVRANDIVSTDEDVTLRVTAEDPDGEIVSIEWDLGDGSDKVTTTGPLVDHRYPLEGEYTVHVIVTDDAGATATTFFTVERVPPVVMDRVIASADPDEVFIGETILFEAELLEGPDPSYSVTWDLGDGNQSVEWTLEHIYAEPGTYTVKVTAIDAKAVIIVDQLVVKVLWIPNESPVAVPSVEQWVMPGHNLRFSDGSFDPDGYIVLWQWDFDGDGTFDHTNITDGNHTHVYPDEGLFTAVLKVTDNRGEVGIATVNIKVDRDAPDDDPVDDTVGAAVCCVVTVVILVVVAYWALRRSMVTPRKDGGPVGPPEGVGPENGTGDGEEPEPAPSDD